MLLSSTQTLELVLDQPVFSTQMIYMANYVDEVLSSISLGALGSNDGNSNDTTAVTIVSSPSSGTVRKVSGISIFNPDGQASVIILRIRNVVAVTTRVLIKVLLIDGETLYYSDLRGFIIINANGELRVAISDLPSGSGSSSTVPLHAITHESGGDDEIPLDRLGVPADTTTLNATTSTHGLLLKLSGIATNFLSGAGTWIATTAIIALGTIVTGVWNATKIGLLYGGTNVDLSSSGSSTAFLAQDASHVISARSIIAGDVPTLNQNTTGNALTATSAATLTTPRTIAGVSFNGSANIAIPATGLSDYATGNWTPSDQSGGGLSFSVTSATYTVIGNLVFVRCHLTYPVTADVNASKIGGLPFTVAAFGAAPISSNAAINLQVGEFLSGTTNFQPFGIANAGTILNSSLSGFFVVFSGCYLK